MLLLALQEVSQTLEVASSNIRVNSIHPSPVNTRMMRSLEAGFAPDNAEGAKEQLSWDSSWKIRRIRGYFKICFISSKLIKVPP